MILIHIKILKSWKSAHHARALRQKKMKRATNQTRKLKTYLRCLARDTKCQIWIMILKREALIERYT